MRLKENEGLVQAMERYAQALLHAIEPPERAQLEILEQTAIEKMKPEPHLL